MRIKCDRCGKRREHAYTVRVEAWIPDVGGYEDFGQLDAGICAQCKCELMLPASLDKMLRRAIKMKARSK